MVKPAGAQYVVKMLQQEGPKIDANGKYDKPTNALLW